MTDKNSPLDKLTELETGISITAVSEHGNTYNGEFNWDSEEETHTLGNHKLVADYDENTLYLVKPIEDETITGYLARIVSVKTEENSE